MKVLPLLIGLLLALLLSGCAAHRVDWASRVGNYTLDQAITEYGPPDKQAKLTDNTVVAEWLTRRGYQHAYIVPSAYPYGGYYGSAYTYTDSPDYFLRLTFDPDGRLKAWKKFAR